MEIVSQLTHIFAPFDYLVLLLNLFLFVFARPVIRFIRGKSDSETSNHVLTLRAVNVVLLILYTSTIFFSDLTKQLSQTGLTLLLAVMATYLINGLVLKQYGKRKEIEGDEYLVDTYQSEVFGLIVVVLAIVAALLIIINIWGITSWLKATSVLGGLLIVLFSTKDVWAPENINGLILLYNGDVEPGALVRVDDLNLLAIVLQTTLTQTRMRDLVSRHKVIVPNSRLRNSKIEILSKATSKGIYQYVEFNISYGIASEQVEELFTTIWERAVEAENAIHADRPARAKVTETGDHAVCWKLCYWVGNVYGLIDARHAINRAAYDVSLEQGVDLNTPFTHTIIGSADYPGTPQIEAETRA